MTKVEILEVVKEMQKDWKLAVDGDREYMRKCRTGFCWHIFLLEETEIIETNYDIINELEKDLVHVNQESSYWYITYMLSRNKQAFNLRLDHINRTIARLENEIKLENAAI